MEKLQQFLEALIFSAVEPISFKTIHSTIEEFLDVEVPHEDIEQALNQLEEYYTVEDRAIEIVQLSGGYQFMTKGAFYPLIEKHLKQKYSKRLTKSALETLSIIAYKQPVTKTEVDSIRGVNSDYAIQKLLNKDLVSIVGRESTPGRPLLYGTSEKFMHHFGLNNIKDLPQLKELDIKENTIGNSDEILEKISLEEE